MWTQLILAYKLLKFKSEVSEFMEDMISKIIELDKKAKESLTKAKQKKIDSEQKIIDIKNQKRNFQKKLIKYWKI